MALFSRVRRPHNSPDIALLEEHAEQVMINYADGEV